MDPSLCMRAYKFLNAHFGLKSLYEKRLKISRLDELNDPFELMPFDLSDRGRRCAIRETTKELGKKQGIICFSAAWTDPVIWAHYSDKHRGLCLGFELVDGIGTRVNYVSDRLQLPEMPTLSDTKAMVFT